MARWFNIAGPCLADKHYMLPAAERLPDVMSLIRKEQYFLVHSPRQCGKTTAFRALMREINAKGEMAAMYCSVEAVQPYRDHDKAMVAISDQLWTDLDQYVRVFGAAAKEELSKAVKSFPPSSIVKDTLKWLSQRAGKPFVVFFDEVDCLEREVLVGFLRQLRNGRIGNAEPNTFPVSMALIGLRNIRDYKMFVRPEGQSTGEASPFNVITKAMTIGLFTETEMRELYRQHTDETGQVFEEEALKKAWKYSCGQPWLVNALARWCVEEIHREDFTKPVTGADMDAAKEALIRERGTHLDSLMEKAYDPRIRPIVERMLVGETIDRDVQKDNITYAIELGLLVDDRGAIRPANPIYAETIGRYLSRGTQDDILSKTQENVWVKDGRLDMPGLMKSFQEFWRENATPDAFLSQNFHEAYPHFVLQAFLQRVVNGGGQIIREMAINRGRLDLGVKFGGETFAVEVKTAALYAKSPEKAHEQVLKYMDGLGVSEGWLVIADTDVTKPWEGKISTEDMDFGAKTVHLVRI
ncbi:MAG: ATP-binding protein [Kiritimatiellae bacterium]|nr:ATP-binding protein [Kiritimatiellia bacterium]